MARVFSVASWNVEHFRKSTDADKARVGRVADFISGKNGGPKRVPDIFALYEVEGKDVYQEFMKKFPKHSFHLTEGDETQEIFIGVKNNIQTFSTQRLEFKTQRNSLRPGLLLSMRIKEVDYTLLFLHIKSGSTTEDLGLRDTALGHAFNLKEALDKSTGGKANFLFMGDLNTMGIDDPVPYSKVLDFSSEKEIMRIAHWAEKRKMKLLSKDKTLIDGKEEEVSWWNGSDGYRPTNLDHLIVSDHMKIVDAKKKTENVSLLGWPKLEQSKWKQWFKDYSDHGMMYFEVHD